LPAIAGPPIRCSPFTAAAAPIPIMFAEKPPIVDCGGGAVTTATPPIAAAICAWIFACNTASFWALAASAPRGSGWTTALGAREGVAAAATGAAGAAGACPQRDRFRSCRKTK
jgi:hypothetical protein